MTTLNSLQTRRAKQTAKKLAKLKDIGKFSRAFIPREMSGFQQNRFGNLSRGRQARELLSRNKSWVYTCANKNGVAVAQVPLRLYATTGVGEKDLSVPHRKLSDKEVFKMFDIRKGSSVYKQITASTVSVSEILVHPFLDLMADVNPFRQQFDTFSESQQFLDLTGDCYWYLCFDDPLAPNVPTSFYLLPTQWVSVVPSTSDWIAGYWFGRNTNEAIPLTTTEVIQFRNANPNNQFHGRSCLEAVDVMYDLAAAMNVSETAINKNSAIPHLIISYDGKNSLKQRTEIEAQWNRALRGLTHDGKVKATDKTFQVTPISLPPREMQYLEGRKWSMKEICAAFGVPESMVASEGSNRASALTSQELYARYTVLPRLTLFEQTMNQQLIPFYNEPRIFCAFDSPIPEDLAFQLEKAVNLYQGGVITRDEARAVQGFAPAMEGGDEYSQSQQAMTPKKDEPSNLDNSDGVADENANA